MSRPSSSASQQNPPRYDSSVNERYMYSKQDVLYESNHVQVYAGVDSETGQPITLRIVDENAFRTQQDVNSSQKDGIFQSGIELHASEMALWMALANTNASRKFSPEVVDIVQFAKGKTLFALASTPLTSLRELLSSSNKKYLTESDALLVLAQIATGVKEYHLANHVHGSITLDNVLVMNNPSRVCLSKISLQAGTYSKLTPAMVDYDIEISTYLAPEILLNISRKPSQQADIYALGAVLFRLLRGCYLYGGSNRSEIYDILSQHNINESGWMTAFESDKQNDLPIQVTKETEKFLARMLARKAEDRPKLDEVIQFCLNNTDKAVGTPVNNIAINGIFETTHAIFDSSRSKKSIEAGEYFDQEVYFGFIRKNTQSGGVVAVPVNVKIVSSNEGDMLEQFILKLNEYKAITDEMYASSNDQGDGVARVHEIVKLPSNRVAILMDYSNQGTLEDYLSKRKTQTNRSTLQSVPTMLRMLRAAATVSDKMKMHSGIHPANISMNSSTVLLGPPLLLKSTALAKKANVYDYFPPEMKKMKSDKSHPEEAAESNNPAADSWSYGMSFYRSCFGDLPIFDMAKKPIFQQSSFTVISEGTRQVIESCLVVDNDSRPTLADVLQFLDEAGTTLKQEEDVQKSNYDDSRIHELMPAVNNLKMQVPKVTVQDLEGNDALFQYKDNQSEQFRMKNMLTVSKAQNNINPEQLNARTRNSRGGKFFNRQRRGDAAGDILNDDSDGLSDITASDTQANGFFHLNKGTGGGAAGGLNGDGNNANPRAKDVGYYDNTANNEELLMNQTMTSDFNKPNQTLQIIELDSNPNDQTTLNQERLLDDDDDPNVIRGRGIIRAKDAIEDEEFVAKGVEGTQGLQIVPSFAKGGASLRLIKMVVKLVAITLILLVVFFRKNIANSWEAMTSKNSLKIVTITMISGSVLTTTQITDIITPNTSQFMQTNIDYEHLKQRYGCIDNLYFFSSTSEMTLLDVLTSSGYGFYAFMCFASLILLVCLRLLHVFRIDLLTAWQNSQSGLLRPFNKHLLHCHVLSYLDFSFLYYAHYQFFHLFFYSNYSPCFGVEQYSNTIPILSDASRFVLSGEATSFVGNIFLTIGIASILHLGTVIFYIFFPLKMSSLFMHPLHIVFRVFSYLGYAWIICRIGMSLTFQPTYGYDELRVIPFLLGKGEYQAVFGYIPEILELILIMIDVCVEFACHYYASALENKANNNNNSMVNSSRLGSSSAWRNNNNSSVTNKNDSTTTKRKREQQQSAIEIQRTNPALMKSVVKNYSGGMQVQPSRIVSTSKYQPSISNHSKNTLQYQ